MIGALALAALAAPAEMRFDIAAKPFVDLHFHVRALAASKEPHPEIAEVAGLSEAVEAARALDRELQSPIAWGYVEGLIGECQSARDGTLAMAKTRKTIETLGSRNIELREGALKLAAALEKAEPAFLEKVWPAHKQAIEEASARIAKTFDGKEGACLDFVAKHLRLPSDERPIPVRLVYEAPFPGAVTHRKPGGGGVCFVSVKGVEGTQLLESVLHEAIHALDVLGRPAPGEERPPPPAREPERGTDEGSEEDPDEESEDAPEPAEPRRTEDPAPSVLDVLRARLEKAGLTRRDREWRDVPHTLMFVQAGETIRRIVDPKHEHYGVVAKYYDKVRAIADVELETWTAYLDGKTTRGEAIDRFVSEFSTPKTPR